MGRRRSGPVQAVLDRACDFFAPITRGVLVHCDLQYENILQENYLNKPQWGKIFDLAAIVLLGIITSLGVQRMNALQGAVWSAGLFGV